MINDKIIAAFAAENIEELAFAKVSDLHIKKEYLMPEGVKSAIIWLLPYGVGEREGNISLYARTLDYHYLSKSISDKVAERLKAEFRGEEFYNFSDHSPIAEVPAAAAYGLGIIGKNHLLINQKYGSFVFVCTLFTTLEAECRAPGEIRSCTGCGACERACPTKAMSTDMSLCLSGINQKKGILSEEEKELIVKSGMVWGCDACQLSCPMNKNAADTPVELFYENRIEKLTPELLASMDDEEFSKRAFSFRGRAVLERNLSLF